MDASSVSPLLRPKNWIRIMHSADRRIVVTLPDGNVRLLKLIARSLLIIVVIIAFPWVRSTVGSLEADNDSSLDIGSIDGYDFLQVLLRDLSSEGLIRQGSRGVLIGGIGEPMLEGLGMDLVVFDDSGTHLLRSIPSDSLDFVFADSFPAAAGSIERVLKIGGVVAMRLNGGASDGVLIPRNYKIVRVHHFGETIVAMQKTSKAIPTSPEKGPLCGGANAMANRRLAMRGLEDVPLEPLNRNSFESDQYMESTKYLPDLMGDSLEGYPRRIFIDVGWSEDGAGTGWFEKHYPTRNQEFEMLKMALGQKGEISVPKRMSDWLRSNVKEEEYVVLKAETDVVEEMMRSKAICLVDELFLECQHQDPTGSKAALGRRAYWECLSLLGQLRNEGIATHQWWGAEKTAQK